jgi:hypothetical protein
MAATKYQVLYRYINEATNTAITNSMDNAYDPVCEFYTDPDHKIFSTQPSVQAEAINEQQEMISFGNSSSNPKTNMLFAYDGTKKVKHKKWVDANTGYVVRDWSRIKRSDIGNQGDFTKEFTTLNASTPEDGGLVVCNKEVFNKYFPSTITVTTDNSMADAGTASNPFYTDAKINEMIKESTLFSLNTSGYQEHCSPSKTVSLKTSFYDSMTYYNGPVAIEGNAMRTYTGYQNASVYGQPDNRNLYGSVTVKQDQVTTTIIPGHYEEAIDAPYLIKDTYKRIKLSPWFVNYTCGSLEAALGKARVLVDMLGIENVKVIKIVPFDQFVRIK